MHDTPHAPPVPAQIALRSPPAVLVLLRWVACVCTLALVVGLPATLRAQVVIVEARVAKRPEANPAHFALLTDAVDDLKGVRVVPAGLMKKKAGEGSPSAHIPPDKTISILRDKVSAAYTLSGGADPAAAASMAGDAATKLRLAVVAGAEAEVRAIFFGALAALARARLALGKKDAAGKVLEDAAMYVSEYEVTADAYGAELAELYERATTRTRAIRRHLEVTASDPDAEILIDGLSAGKGSFRGEVPTGKHYMFARIGTRTSRLMVVELGDTGTSVELDLIDKDLVRFSPHPIVDFSSLKDRTMNEPVVAADLLRRGGAHAVGMVSWDGEMLEMRVYEVTGRLMGSGASKPDTRPLKALAKRLEPVLLPPGSRPPPTEVAKGDDDRRDDDRRDDRSADKGKPKRDDKGSSKKVSGGGGAKFRFTGSVGAGAGLTVVGIVLAGTFGALGQGAETEIRERLELNSGYFDYGHRLRLRFKGRVYNGLAITSLLLAIGGGAAAVYLGFAAGRKKKKSGPAAGLHLRPDGLVLEF